MKLFLVTSVLLLAGILFVSANDPASQSIPDGPLLRKPGEFCAWQILFSYAASHPLAGNPLLPAPPRKVVFTRTKKLWHAITHDIAENVLEQCFDGNQEYIIGTTQEAPTFCPTEEGHRASYLVDFGAGNYPDMEWVSQSTFVRMESVQDRPCLVFQKDDMVAWVDEQTRFPFLWRRGAETRVFQQLPPPTNMLQLPAKVVKFTEALKRDAEALSRSSRRGAATP